MAALVGSYLARLQSEGALVALHHDEDKAPFDWYVRFEGDSRDYVAIWLRVRERMLSFESYLMPPPEENAGELYLYLLRVNHRLVGMKFGVGGDEETGVFLTGQMPVECTDESVLDELVGACWETIEAHFVTAMTIGFGDRFRPRAR